MEATSDNWKPPFYLLEAHGFQTWLVNAKNVKHLPGRPKTDRLDAVGLCKVAERQMLRPNFVPPVPIRRLRDLPGTGRYDPATINDRLLLGLKGTMSEAELHFIRARLQGDCWPRPPAANSPCTYPPGWSTTRCPTSCWTPTPVYATRPRTCSTPSRPPARATATVKAFAAESLLFPARHLGGPHTGELYWKPAPRQCAVRAAQPRLRRRLLLRPALAGHRCPVPSPHRHQTPTGLDHPDPRCSPRLHQLGTVRDQPGHPERQRRRPRRGPQSRLSSRRPGAATGPGRLRQMRPADERGLPPRSGSTLVP
jgi:hypothetical protein